MTTREITDILNFHYEEVSRERVAWSTWKSKVPGHEIEVYNGKDLNCALYNQVSNLLMIISEGQFCIKIL